MATTFRRCCVLVGAVAVLAALALTGVARAQEAVPKARPGAGEAAAIPKYKFSLAPGKEAPQAKAEVLLAPKAEGGYTAEITATALPEPKSVKPDAVTYVVWLYDPDAKKKERVGTLAMQGGTGTASFDVNWPKFAIVVTAEPSEQPEEWSGIAVLTGQPALPENVAGPGGGEQKAPGAEAATPAPKAAPGAGAKAGAAPAPGAQVGAGNEPGAGEPGAAAEPGMAGEAPQPGAVTAGPTTPSGEAAPGKPPAAAGASAGAGERPAPGAVAAAPQAGAAAGAAADTGAVGAQANTGAAGAEAGVGVSVEAETEAEMAAPPARGGEATAEAEEKGKNKRVRNEALDRMHAVARGEEGGEAKPAGRAEAKSAKPAEGGEKVAESGAGAGESRETTAVAGGGGGVAARVDLEGSSKSPDADGKLELHSDGSARLTAKKLPAPSELGPGLNTFVLWTIDPATGRSQSVGVLEESAGGIWTLAASGIQPGASLAVTAEAGPEATSRSGPVVLTGKWEGR